MKFILSMIICTSVYNTCLPPHQMDEVYNTHYECMIAGYEESIAKSKEINKYGTIIKFFCYQAQEAEEKIIIPPPKPKVKA